MIHQLEDAKLHIISMRQALLEDGSVNPMADEPTISHTEAKKKVLKYLDLFAAALAAAHFRRTILETDCIFDQLEKDAMTKEIMESLRKELDVLSPAIKDYFFCLGKHFEIPLRPTPRPSGCQFTLEELTEKRQIVRETLSQLELLQREMDDLLGELFASGG
jgi:hypothetical protein